MVSVVAILLALGTAPRPAYQIRTSLNLSGGVVAHLATKRVEENKIAFLVVFDRHGLRSRAARLPVDESGTNNRFKRGDHGSVIIAGDEDESAVESWLLPIRFKNATCVLAEQEFGFQIIIARHTVVCLENGGALEKWTRAVDSAGPFASHVDLCDLDGDGFDELTYYRTQWSGFSGDSDPEMLDVETWKWSAGKLREARFPVHLIVAGRFATGIAAHQARDQAEKANQECGYDFSVLAEEDGRFALATKTTRVPKSLPHWKQWQACYPELKIEN